MLFVSGLMGPYMAPIPANASAAMLFSFFVAMVIAPWLMLRLHPARTAGARARRPAHGEGLLGRLYRRVAAPVVRSRRSRLDLPDRGRRRDRAGLRAVRHQERDGQAAAVRQQVGTAGGGRSARGRQRSRTPSARCSRSPASARQLPEVRSIEAYAGTPAPFNFNGLVRHYYLRESPELGELQINLAPTRRPRPREPRHRARSARSACKRWRLPHGTVAQGGRGAAGPAGAGDAAGRDLRPRCRRRRRAVAAELKKIFASVPYIVDIDDFDRRAAAAPAHLDRPGPAGVLRRRAARRLRHASRRCSAARRSAIRIAARTAIRSRSSVRPAEARSGLERSCWPRRRCRPTALPGNKTVVELGEVVRVSQEAGSPAIFRRDGHFADMVMAELAGAYEAPIYGMLAVDKLIDAHDWGTLPQAGDPLARPAGGRDASRRCCGTASGRSPTSRSATWARRSGSRSSASTSWWWRSSAASSCRW